MVNKLLAFPMFIMIGLSFLCFYGLNDALLASNPDAARQLWFETYGYNNQMNLNNATYMDETNRPVAVINVSTNEHTIYTGDPNWTREEGVYWWRENVTYSPYLKIAPQIEPYLELYIFTYVNSTGEYLLHADTGAATLPDYNISLMKWSFDGNYMFIGIFVSLIIFGGLIGLKVFSTGLGEGAWRAAFYGVALLVVWLTVSSGTTLAWWSIPNGLGWVAYVGMTFIYGLGMFEMMGSGGD